MSVQSERTTHADFLRRFATYEQFVAIYKEQTGVNITPRTARRWGKSGDLAITNIYGQEHVDLIGSAEIAAKRAANLDAAPRRRGRQPSK